MTAELRAAVDAVYAEVDAAVAAARPVCHASGKCCRFAEYGHTLFLSRFEADILLETAPGYDRPVSRDGCPFQVGNLCTARAERPLGCRVYFCDPSYAGVGESITEDALAKLKRLADEHGTGWEYAPLHHFLNTAEWPAGKKTVPLLLVGRCPTLGRPMAGTARPTRPIMLLLLALAVAPAADWPQFLGPTRDGVTTEVIPAWTDKPAVAWKRPVGPAHSSPVVSGGVVYVFDQPPGKNADRLTALDLATGKVVWEKSYDRPEFKPLFGEGPRGTPSVTGGKVYTLGGTGVLACWDAKTGDVVWQRDTLKDFKAENLVFGVSASPLVADGRVFVNVGGKGAGLVAFDAATGKTLWQTTDDGASYSSPILADGGVVFLTKLRLVAVDPATGAVRWSHPFQDQMQESATAPLWADGTLVGSSVTLGSVALTPGPDGVKEKWKSRKLNCYFSTPVLAGESLYMLNGVLSFTPSITLRCVDPATGKVRWEKANVGKYHAALTRDGAGNLLMFADDGRLTLFAADTGKYRELAAAKVSGPTWAHPAVAGGYVVIRDEKELVALKLK